MADSEETTGEMSDGLQVELFHPESDREPGDTNIQALGFDIHPVVFPVALVLIVTFIAITVLGPMFGLDIERAYNWLFGFIGDTFGWFYLLAVNIFIAVLLYFALGKYGTIKIGGVEAEKEFSDFSWMAMLFSAGMGIGLMFFSVSEPLNYFRNTPSFFGAEAETGAAASLPRRMVTAMNSAIIASAIGNTTGWTSNPYPWMFVSPGSRSDSGWNSST